MGRGHHVNVVRAGLAFALLLGALGAGAAERTLTLEAYRDKMKGGWIGQMVGVAWGQPTEFKWNDVVIPADKVPVWTSDFPVRYAYGNDDLYVEMTFLKTLEDHGLDVSIRQAGIDFANSQYPRPPTPRIRRSTRARTTSTTRSRPTTRGSSRRAARRRRSASATSSGG